MQSNETRTLWISIIAAIFSIVLLYGWAQGKRSDYARRFGQTKTVLVASEDIYEMSLIDESKLELVEKPSDFVEPDALDNKVAAVGLMPLAPIKKGEQILNTKLVSPGASTGLSMQVSPQKRAITIPVDDIQGVSKLIRPGDRIDLVASNIVGQADTKKLILNMLMQDVAVLAVGKHIVDNLPVSYKGNPEDGLEIYNLRVENNYSNITIEVKPDDALKIYHIIASGNRLYSLLRNPNDRFKKNFPSVDQNTVLKKSRRTASAGKISNNRKSPLAGATSGLNKIYGQKSAETSSSSSKKGSSGKKTSGSNAGSASGSKSQKGSGWLGF